jgi:hypothetical protein
MATVMPIEQELKYMGTEPTIEKEHIEKARENYDDVCEAFLDSVFGADSTRSMSEWCKNTLENEKWVVNPNEIRKKLGYK